MPYSRLHNLEKTTIVHTWNEFVIKTIQTFDHLENQQ